MAGFPPDTLTFLSDLADDPTPGFFDAHRDRYHDHCLGPARAFVEAAAPLLASLSPRLRAVARVHGSILHPRQDVRFAPHRPRYRDHVGLLFWEGERATAPSVLYLRVHPDHVTIVPGRGRSTATPCAPTGTGWWTRSLAGRWWTRSRPSRRPAGRCTGPRW